MPLVNSKLNPTESHIIFMMTLYFTLLKEKKLEKMISKLCIILCMHYITMYDLLYSCSLCTTIYLPSFSSKYIIFTEGERSTEHTHIPIP